MHSTINLTYSINNRTYNVILRIHYVWIYWFFYKLVSVSEPVNAICRLYG